MIHYTPSFAKAIGRGWHRLIAIATLFLGALGAAYAQELPPASPATREWEMGAFTGFASHHWGKCEHETRICRDSNPGFGFVINQGEIHSTLGVTFGQHINSNNLTSNYFMVLWRPQETRTCNDVSCLGIAVTGGYVSGYPDYPLMGFPFLYARYRLVELQVVINPIKTSLVPIFISGRLGLYIPF